MAKNKKHNDILLIPSGKAQIPDTEYFTDPDKFERINDGIILTDGNDKIIYINKTAIKLLGVSNKKLVGKSINNLKKFLTVTGSVKKSEHSPLNFNKNWKGELRYGKSGIDVYLNTQVFIKKDRRGKISNRQIIFNDITERKKIFEELSLLEERYSQSIENSPNPIFSVDAKGRILTWNKSCEHVLKYTKNEILGKPVTALLSKDKKQLLLVKKSIQSIFQNKNTSSLEINFKLPDSSSRIALSRLYPVSLNKKTMSCCFTSIDITEIKKNETEIRESEKNLKLLIERMLSGFAICKIICNKAGKPIDFEFQSINNEFEKILNIQSKDVIGKRALKIFPGIEKTWIEKLGEVALKGKPVNFEAYSKNLDKYFEIRAHCHERGKFAILFNDISERKKNEEELRKLKRAVEYSPATILITDKSGKIEYANPMFTDVTGYSFEEVYGKNPRLLKSGEKSSVEYKELWDTILAGMQWKGEFHNKKKNGELFWESALISPVKNDRGKITHFIAIKEDVTKYKSIIEEMEKAKEDAIRAERLKSEFLAQMSHEIRSPLNVILNFTSLIQEEIKEKLTPEFSDSFDSIQIAGRRIIRTIDLILNMAELQTNNYEPVFKRVNLKRDIITPIEKQYKLNAESKNLKLNIIYKTDILEITADEYIIGQIFANLIDNAIKYTQSGSVNLIVDYTNTHHLRIKVKDTGVGIASDYLPKLFDPFSQEEQGYGRSFEGNGLGLALVKRYCEMNNADITVESRKGTGTTFTVVFK